MYQHYDLGSRHLEGPLRVLPSFFGPDNPQALSHQVSRYRVIQFRLQLGQPGAGAGEMGHRFGKVWQGPNIQVDKSPTSIEVQAATTLESLRFGVLDIPSLALVHSMPPVRCCASPGL